MEKRKPPVAVLQLGFGLGKDKKPDKEALPEKESYESASDDLSAVAQEILDAISAKDADGLSEALKAFVESCSVSSEGEEPEEEDNETQE